MRCCGEFVNAVAKSAMSRLVTASCFDSAAAVADRFAIVLAERDSLTIGVLPRGLLLDGAVIEPLPTILREFAVRLHRKNIGAAKGAPRRPTGRIVAIGALAAADADTTIGREGFRLTHVRIEPLVYDVLGFADAGLEQELDDVFWSALIEAAFGREFVEGEPPHGYADRRGDHRARGAELGRRASGVRSRSAAFSIGHCSSRRPVQGRRAAGSSTCSAHSRSTTNRVIAAAPSTSSRRRFLRETLELVPPSLLLQLLEAVAQADGEPISPQQKAMLGKLAGKEQGGDAPAVGGFATSVLGLVEQWDGTAVDVDEEADPRMGIESARVLATGLEVSLASPEVIEAGRRLADRGQLLKALQLLDHPQNDPVTSRAIADALLDPGLLEQLLRTSPPDFPLIERVAQQSGVAAVDPLLDALETAEERATRRRLLDILARLGPASEPELLDRLDGAPWYHATFSRCWRNFRRSSRPHRSLRRWRNPNSACARKRSRCCCASRRAASEPSSRRWRAGKSRWCA